MRSFSRGGERRGKETEQHLFADGIVPTNTRVGIHRAVDGRMENSVQDEHEARREPHPHEHIETMYE